MDPANFNAKIRELSLTQGGVVGGGGRTPKSPSKPAPTTKEQDAGAQSQAFAAVGTKPSKSHRRQGADTATAAADSEKRRAEKLAESSKIYNALVGKLKSGKSSAIAVAAELNESTGGKLFVMNGSRLQTPLKFRPGNDKVGICSRFTFMLQLGSDKGKRVYANPEQIAMWSLLCDTVGDQTSPSRLGQMYADSHDSSWLEERKSITPTQKKEKKEKRKDKPQSGHSVHFEAFDPFDGAGGGVDGEFA